MDQTGQIQTVNGAGNSGTVLTAGGSIIDVVKPPSVTQSISPGTSVTVRVIGIPQPGGETRTIAIIVSVP